MADAKQLRALKITSKHGTEAQWAALETPYIPNSGEIIVFVDPVSDPGEA